jgi:hypothetical protein
MSSLRKGLSEDSEGGEAGVPAVEDETAEGEAETAGESEINGKALGCLAADNGFRLQCHALFRNSVFQGIVLVLIVANTVLLALQGPRHTLGAEFDEFVAWFDIAITGVFPMRAGVCQRRECVPAQLVECAGLRRGAGHLRLGARLATVRG